MSNFILSGFADEIDMDLKVQMDSLEKLNISYIEIRGVNGKCIVDYSLSEVKSIKKQLDERNFKISSIGSPIGKIPITAQFESHLDLSKHTIDIAHILDSKYIRLFSFFIPNGENPKKYRDEVMYRWSKFVDVSKGSHITLLHENEKRIYGDTPERCLDILKTMDSPFVKAVFDPANFIQCGVSTYPEAFNLLKNYVEYVHIKDALYSNGSVVPCGKGDGNILKILSELYANNYNGFLSLEPHLGLFDGLEKLENSDLSSLRRSNFKLFKVAYNALMEILHALEK